MKKPEIFSLGWYAFAIAAVGIYGGQVCPYIEGLDVRIFVLELAVVVALMYLVRLVLFRVVEPGSPLSRVLMETSLLLGAGLVLTLYNRFVHGFPLSSGMKLVLALIIVGYFLGIHHVLLRQHGDILEGRGRSSGPGRARSIVAKFSQVTVLSLLLFGGIITMVFAKDLDWLRRIPANQVPGAVLAVAVEVFFVLAVMLGMGTVLIIAYSRNLKALFDVHTQVLESVTEGDLARSIPVFSLDEFGRLAFYTNQMILGLREKDRIQDVLGKVVNPHAAEKLLRGENLEGQKQDVTILMCDIRNFTTFAEENSADEVVRNLNLYFKHMVEIIGRHNGILDKFIGDGLLAIFGLNPTSESSPDDAVRCAVEMLREAGELQDRLSIPLRMGIGIHSGEVIMGRIGSPERLEYTAIGDTVNTAARLEGATKTLGFQVVISRNVYTRIKDPDAWRDLGELKLKGKRNAIHAYGIGAVHSI